MENRLRDYSEDRVYAPDLARPEDKGQGDSWIGRQWAAATRRIEQCMGKYPTATVAVGLSVGVLIGWIIKRR